MVTAEREALYVLGEGDVPRLGYSDAALLALGESVSLDTRVVSTVLKSGLNTATHLIYWGTTWALRYSFFSTVHTLSRASGARAPVLSPAAVTTSTSGQCSGGSRTVSSRDVPLTSDSRSSVRPLPPCDQTACQRTIWLNTYICDRLAHDSGGSCASRVDYNARNNKQGDLWRSAQWMTWIQTVRTGNTTI